MTDSKNRVAEPVQVIVAIPMGDSSVKLVGKVSTAISFTSQLLALSS